MHIIYHLRAVCLTAIELPARCGPAALVAADISHRRPTRLPHLLFVKICCIASVEEARLAVLAGASALGLVSAMPSGPGVITDDLIAEIAATVAPYGLDLCSSVRSEGRLDAAKLGEFFRALRASSAAAA